MSWGTWPRPKRGPWREQVVAWRRCPKCRRAPAFVWYWREGRLIVRYQFVHGKRPFRCNLWPWGRPDELPYEIPPSTRHVPREPPGPLESPLG